MSDNSFPISDSTFLLSTFGIIATCFSGFLAFILKSRCTRISCCGLVIDRDVIPPDQINQLDRSRHPNSPPRDIEATQVITRT